jgi:hypothetical protein
LTDFNQTVLTSLLWDIRAQVEAQLRCLTKLHQRLDGLPRRTPQQRAADIEHILKDLTDIYKTHTTLEPICAEALAAAHRLKTTDC